jgi:hypothetical protein
MRTLSASASGFRDHAQAAIAADDAVEHVGVLRGAGRDLGAVGQHHPERAHGADDRALPHVAAVGIDRQRAPTVKFA